MDIKFLIFKIIEYCGSKNTITREQYYIYILKPKYNRLNNAGSSLGFIHKETTIIQMSINNTKDKHAFFPSEKKKVRQKDVRQKIRKWKIIKW